jgi:hypothetical protein
LFAMKIGRLFWAVFISLALSQILSAGALPNSAEEQDVVEAVFRYELRQHSPGKTWKVFYLAIGLENPSAPAAEFMTRFREQQPLVKRFVGSEYSSEQMVKEHGLVLGIGGVKWKSATEAEVEGYRFVVPGEAQGFRFEVKREEGEWVVKSSTGTWVASRAATNGSFT